MALYRGEPVYPNIGHFQPTKAPLLPTNGDVWYDSSLNELLAYINGSTVNLGGVGSAPTLDAVLNPVASKTFTLGTNALTFTGAAGITLTNTGANQTVTIQNGSGATGASGVSIVNRSSSGALNVTDINGTGMFFQSQSASTGLIQLSIGVGNSPEITLNNSGITTVNAGTGGTSVTDSGGGGIKIHQSHATTPTGTKIIDDSTDFGIFINTTASVGASNGIYLEDQGSGGITLDASTGTGILAIDTNVTGGLMINGTAGFSHASSDYTAFTFSNGFITAATPSSDERIKKDIKPFTIGLDAILQIEPITYWWDKEKSGIDSDHEWVGFSAQNVQKVIPVATPIDPSTGYLEFNDKGIIAALVNAVKELNAKLNDLTNSSGK